MVQKTNLVELEKNIDITDKGLEQQISRFQDERVLKDDVISSGEDEDGNSNTLIDTNSINKKKDIDKPQASTNVVEPCNSEDTKWKDVVLDTNSSNKKKDIHKPQAITNVVEPSNSEVNKMEERNSRYKQQQQGQRY